MRRFRYAYLLAALVLVAFARPFIESSLIAPAVVDLLLFVSILHGAWEALERKVLFLPVIVLGLLSAVLQAFFVATAESQAVLGAFVGASLLFYGAAALVIIGTLFERQDHVTSDTLCQAVSAFLLLGLVWAMAYSLLEMFAPGSFVFSGVRADEPTPFKRFVGFSFTTLTTLGYGNIAPATTRADALANAQALVGQIYVAVVIARLVAIQLAESRQDGDERRA